MRPHATAGRAGFTLIELLVAMAIIITLATIAVAVIPGALDQDRTTDAAATIRQHLTIAKARATRENLPRGIRLIVGTDPNNVAKTNPLWVTELQYIEAAPPIIPNPYGVTTVDPATSQPPPYAELIAVLDSAGNLTRIDGFIRNVDKNSDLIQVMQSDLLANWFPILALPPMGLTTDGTGTYPGYEVTNVTASTPAQDAGSPGDWKLTLNTNSTSPAPWLGAGTSIRVYQFAVRPRSRPLLGEPNIQLPRNVCIDLDFGMRCQGGCPVSLVPSTTTAIDPELMFSPSGQLISPPNAGGQLYLWVRDYTKFNGQLVTTAGSNGTPVATQVYNPAAFQQGGEQQVIAIRAKTGSLGVFPIQWPDNIGAGTYTATPPWDKLDPAGLQGPFRIATAEASSP